MAARQPRQLKLDMLLCHLTAFNIPTLQRLCCCLFASINANAITCRIFFDLLRIDSCLLLQLEHLSATYILAMNAHCS
jgi:hypothetical protein